MDGKIKFHPDKGSHSPNLCSVRNIYIIMCLIVRHLGSLHMQAADKILLYLKTTLGMGLIFRKGESLSVKIYTDANYADCHVDKGSTSGYCMSFGGNLVT